MEPEKETKEEAVSARTGINQSSNTGRNRVTIATPQLPDLAAG